MSMEPEGNAGGRFRQLRDSMSAGRQAAEGLAQQAGESSPAHWVRSYLSRHAMPEVPVQGEWEFSASALIGPQLPRAVRLVPKALDLLGRIRFSPYSVAIDQRTEVPWADVVEIRTRPLLDLLTVDLSEQVTSKLLILVRTPILRPAAGFLAGKVPELVLSILRVAIGPDSRFATLQVPVEIDYAKGRRKNIKTMTPGVLSSAVLAFPQVAQSLLATASWHQVPIRYEPPRTNATAEQAAYLLSERLRLASDHLRRLRAKPQPAELTAGAPEAPQPPLPEGIQQPPPSAEQWPSPAAPAPAPSDQQPRRRPRTPYTGQS